MASRCPRCVVAFAGVIPFRGHHDLERETAPDHIEDEPMEPWNRPYVAPDTEPGDAGTEQWADEVPDPEVEGSTKHGPLAEAPAPTGEGGALEGSPADELQDEDAISARNIDLDEPAGD
jgi:hypothetical protein